MVIKAGSKGHAGLFGLKLMTLSKLLMSGQIVIPIIGSPNIGTAGQFVMRLLTSYRKTWIFVSQHVSQPWAESALSIIIETQDIRLNL